MKSKQYLTAVCLTGLLAMTVAASGRKRDEDSTDPNEKKRGSQVQQPQPQPRQMPQPQPRQMPQPQPRQMPQPQPRQMPQPQVQARQLPQVQPQPQPRKRVAQLETPQSQQLVKPLPKPKFKPESGSLDSPTGGKIKGSSIETDRVRRNINPDTLKKGPGTKDLSTTDVPKKLPKDPTITRHAETGAATESIPKIKPPPRGPVTESPANLHKTTDPDVTARLKHPDTEGTKAGIKSLPEPKIQKLKDGSVATSHFSEKGKLTEKVVEQKNGGKQISRFNNNGTLREKVDANKDGTQRKTQFNALGKKTREEVANKDGSKEITTHQLTRSGKNHSTQIIKQNDKGLAVSKTVTVNRPVMLTRRPAFEGTPIIRRYDRGRYGFVYHHGHEQHAPWLIFHRDPYWHNPDGGMHHHPFRYAWGWDRHDWYRHRSYYFPVYVVYPTPVYWITDWMVGSYLADNYETTSYISEEPDREVVVVRPNATPISNELKEDLRAQVENTIAEEDSPAENDSDQPISTDLARALADPKHIYPVSGTLSVTLAADENESVIVSDGDLLKLEPGQEESLKDATENTFVTMRVMTSKGEEGEARAGTLIRVPLKSLQDFDSEFRARIDQGVAEAAANKALFKSGAE